MNRFRDKWYEPYTLFLVLLSVHLILNVPHVDGFHTQRQRYASRMLKITPKECHSPDFPTITGICMISLECQQRSGTVIGACRDGHLFGACCHDPLGSQLKSSTAITEPTSTTTTTTTTEEPTFSSASSSSSQQENNEVIPLSIDSEAQLDSQTAIPSLIDTFSELSPTFLSELALDEHTTGMYASSLPVDDNEQEAALLRQKSEEEEEQTSAANMISNEIVTSTTDRNPRTSSTERYHGVEQVGQQVNDEEVGGLGSVGIDDDFKDNMIKYIDEIVTMRNNEIVPKLPSSPPEPEVSPPPPPPPPPSSPPAIALVSAKVSEPDDEPPTKIPNSIEDMPFSTFTIVSSTKPAEDGKGEILLTSISTTGSGDTMLPTTTTPVPTTSSEEVVSVSIQQSIAALPSSTESNEIRDTTESTVHYSSSTESIYPTKFTFSKLKYSPKVFKPRSTTEKIVWTRPTPSTPAPYHGDNPIELEEDEEDEEEEEEEEDERNNPPVLSSSSTQATSVEQTTIATSTEGGAGGDVSASSSLYGSSFFNDDNVEEQQYYGGDTSTQEYPYYPSSSSPASSSYAPYYDPSSPYPEPQQPISSETPLTPPSSTPFSSSSSPTTEYSFDWSSPTILSLIKGATEMYYAGLNASERSDIIKGMVESTTENEIDNFPSSSTTTWKSTSYPIHHPETSTEKTFNNNPEAGSFSPNPTGGAASSSWDTSIDSFVDQVVEGIVHDLNKSNKIDDIIFNSNQKQGSASVTKKLQASTTQSSSTPAIATSTARSSSSKEKIKKHKTKSSSSIRSKNSSRITSSSESPLVSSTTSKEKLKKVKTPPKVPISVAAATTKRRTNKNKAKPVKKVTTSSIKTANSTRKRLDYKKDCGVRPLIKKGRIVGGTPSQFGSWPWHALVKETVWWGIFSKIKCGGVLIGAQHVLTAAHCQPQQTGTLSVVLGITDSDDTDSRAVTKTVKRIIPHPQFNARTYENDIAILELESPVDFQPHVVPICLPRDDDELEGKTAFVTGMGLLKHDGERPLVLQEVDLPILNNTECQKMFVRSGNMKPIIDSFICAGYEQGRKDSCGGDSGGPLSVKRSNGQWVLAGTVSHGIKCALPDQPGVYMRTSYYKPWIDRVLNVARSRYRGIPRCNAPPLICARQRQHQQQLRQHQSRHENGFVNTLFRIFRLARKMVEEGRKSG